jgi:hypothetical protein
VVAAAGDGIALPVRERFLSWVKMNAVDQKRKDAVSALEYIKVLTNSDLMENLNR